MIIELENIIPNALNQTLSQGS